MSKQQSFLGIAKEYLLSDQTVLSPFDKNTLRIQQEIAEEEPDTGASPLILCL